MNTELSGKIALVTGSSRGIGRAIAECLAREGASVTVNYVQSAQLASDVVLGIERAGGRALAVQADMSKTGDIRRLFETTVDHFGGLDILVHSTAVFLPRSIAEVTEEDFDSAFALNARGTFFTLKEGASRIRDGGRIVYISSSSTAMSIPGMAVYSGSKAACEQFTKTLAKEIGARGITVNTVSHGFTETDMLPTDPGWRKMGAEMSVFKRLGQPIDVAEVVIFLVSDQARWVTGQNIRACGGVAM
jgi:3-oxoacyl-[acyl-carrier protein] reductase